MFIALAATVFGLALGQPVTLPECVKGPPPLSQYADEQPVTCQKVFREYQPRPWEEQSVEFPRSARPEISSSSIIGTRIQDGRLIGIEVDTSGLATQDSVLKQLSAKFGEPRNVTKIPSQTLAGAKSNALIAEWQQPDVYVRYESAIFRIDRGKVFILNPAGKRADDEYNAKKKAERTPL
jgi:hypothetical protein